jgi:hypothetical protein
MSANNLCAYLIFQLPCCIVFCVSKGTLFIYLFQMTLFGTVKHDSMFKKYNNNLEHIILKQIITESIQIL